jgi:ABC-type lipoprotein export system ATPase subunit
VVELANLVHEYPGAVATRVLSGISLTVRAGEFVAVVGSSGSGKTTLLNLIGLLDQPTSGTLRLAGCDVSRLAERERARFRRDYLGFIFQFHYLLPEFTVLENALMPCRIRGEAAEDEARPRIRQLLEQVGLGDRLGYRPGQLSGGQQQRVAIVRALANDPALVLADEPTGNLDSHNGRAVFDLMRELNRTTGKAFLMVTHDELFAARADRIIRLVDGQIQAGAEASALPDI